MSSMYIEAGSLARAGSQLLYVLLRMESYNAESSRSGVMKWPAVMKWSGGMKWCLER
jgi:hypothetical protein